MLPGSEIWIWLLYLWLKVCAPTVSAGLTFFHPLILGTFPIPTSCFHGENPIPKILHPRFSQNFLSCLSLWRILGEFPFSWNSAAAVHKWFGWDFPWPFLCFLGDFFPSFRMETVVWNHFLVKNPFCYYLPALGTCILFIACTQSLEWRNIFPILTKTQLDISLLLNLKLEEILSILLFLGNTQHYQDNSQDHLIQIFSMDFLI